MKSKAINKLDVFKNNAINKKAKKEIKGGSTSDVYIAQQKEVTAQDANK